jgi:hypothetical protein
MKKEHLTRFELLYESLSEEAKQTLDKGLEKTKTSFFSKLTKSIRFSISKSF